MTVPARLPDEEWRRYAACHGHPPEWWTPDTGLYAAAAWAICRACPVRPECADAGRDESVGLWGLTTPTMRGFKPGDIYRRHDPAPHPVHEATSAVCANGSRTATGTQIGYLRHLRAGEIACTACREAMYTYQEGRA